MFQSKENPESVYQYTAKGKPGWWSYQHAQSGIRLQGRYWSPEAGKPVMEGCKGVLLKYSLT